MDLSATVVDKVSFLLRLNMKKRIRELLWELKGRNNLLSSLSQFSARDGVSWISNRFNVDNFWGDREVGKNEISTVDRKVNVRVRATPFL